MQLEAHDLTCIRGGRTVFEKISLQAGSGAGILLTGPNGSGKTSLLRLLAGFISPAKGSVSLAGGAEDMSVGEQCHFVGHLNGVKRTLTVSENLAFWADYLGGGDVAAALETFALSALADIPAGLLSAGQSRRLGLARLALAPRPVWLLDEPTVSLDAASQKILAGVVKSHIGGGGIVVASTHAPLGIKFARELRLGQKRRA